MLEGCMKDARGYVYVYSPTQESGKVYPCSEISKRIENTSAGFVCGFLLPRVGFLL